MLQTSISAWLNKPSATKDTPSSEVSLKTFPAKAPPSATTAWHVTPPSTSNLSTQAATTTGSKTTGQFGPSGPFRRSNLPPAVTFERCTCDNINAFKRVNALLLPVQYPNKFYNEILDDSVTSSITLLAVWRDAHAVVVGDVLTSSERMLEGTKDPGRVIGGIRCRLLPSPQDPKPTLYISSLTLLSPYQHLGIATALLRTVIISAIEAHSISCVTAHVWTANTDALVWYGKRGFREVGTEDGYYQSLKRLGKGTSAVFMRREIGPGDLIHGLG
ncbi:hypothetical protein LTR28_005463 [Elasticomyces elasticus]|nr:hypothetical protein LTR28_005463 [Elasticomyces elasticus]